MQYLILYYDYMKVVIFFVTIIFSGEEKEQSEGFLKCGWAHGRDPLFNDIEPQKCTTFACC